MDRVFEWWKFCNPDKKRVSRIRCKARSDMIGKFISIFSSPRMYEDSQPALPNETVQKKTIWKEVVKTMQKYYHPTKNSFLIIISFVQSPKQVTNMWQTFCNRIINAKHYNFRCSSNESISDELQSETRSLLALSMGGFVGNFELVLESALPCLIVERYKFHHLFHFIKFYLYESFPQKKTPSF